MANGKNTLKQLSASHVVWSWSYHDKLCIPIPWPIGNQCVDIEVSLAILENNGIYSLDVDFLGLRQSFELLQGCIPAMEYGLARLEVCVEPEIVGGVLKACHIQVKACIGFHGLEKCWTLYDQPITVGLVADLPTEHLDLLCRATQAAKPEAVSLPKYFTFEA